LNNNNLIYNSFVTKESQPEFNRSRSWKGEEKQGKSSIEKE